MASGENCRWREIFRDPNNWKVELDRGAFVSPASDSV